MASSSTSRSTGRRSGGGSSASIPSAAGTGRWRTSSGSRPTRAPRAPCASGCTARRTGRTPHSEWRDIGISAAHYDSAPGAFGGRRSRRHRRLRRQTLSVTAAHPPAASMAAAARAAAETSARDDASPGDPNWRTTATHGSCGGTTATRRWRPTSTAPRPRRASLSWAPSREPHRTEPARRRKESLQTRRRRGRARWVDQWPTGHPSDEQSIARDWPLAGATLWSGACSSGRAAAF